MSKLWRRTAVLPSIRLKASMEVRKMSNLKLTREGTKKHPEKVIQFGEGNFLRAFVDYMIDVANEKGLFDGSVVIVKPIEFGNLKMFKDQDCLYTLSHRGRMNGEVVKDYRVITSVSRAIDCYTEYETFMDCAKNPDLRFVVSNTTEAGIVYDETDKFEYTPAHTYPGKLTQFLYARFKAFRGDISKGMIIIPCELIEGNGHELKKCVFQQAENWKLGAEFTGWLKASCTFASTLVDRIVTGYPRDKAPEIWEEIGYQDNLLDTCEPFALWVIETDKDISGEFPLDKAGLPVIFTDNEKPYHERKLRILNGAHTSMVLGAYLAGKDIVRECMEDSEIKGFMDKCLFDEIIPTLTLPKDELNEFAASVTERFQNPFIDHSLLAIALNSVSKWRARVLPSVNDYVKKEGKVPTHLAFSFAALMCFYQGTEIRDKALIGHRGDAEYQILDDTAVLEFCKENTAAYQESRDTQAYVNKFASNVDFWGMDLTTIPGFAEEVVKDIVKIQKIGMKAAISELVK